MYDPPLTAGYYSGTQNAWPGDLPVETGGCGCLMAPVKSAYADWE